MPYFGTKSIGPPPQPVSITQSYRRSSHVISGHRVCGGPFRIGKALPHKTLRLQGCSFRLRPPRALHLRYTQQRFVRRRILPRRHSAPEAHAPYASKARQRSRTCSASAILHRRPTFLFCAHIPCGLAIRRVIVIGNRARRAHVRMAPGVECRLRTKGESNMTDNREMWQSLGMDLETHDQLCVVRSLACSMPRKPKTAFPFLAKIACS